jgi:hypothetical protein
MRTSELPGVRDGSMILRAVVYDSTAQRNMLCELVRRWRAACAAIPESTPLGMGRFPAMCFAAALSTCATSFKSDSFEEECEWRLVTLRPPFLPAQNFEISFRVDHEMIVPYLALSSKDEAEHNRLLPISEVVMGPGQLANVAGHGVEELLRELGYGPEPVPVRSSSVPLRT